jgi:glucan 1,3-beta-glucosidase
MVPRPGAGRRIRAGLICCLVMCQGCSLVFGFSGFGGGSTDADASDARAVDSADALDSAEALADGTGGDTSQPESGASDARDSAPDSAPDTGAQDGEAGAVDASPLFLGCFTDNPQTRDLPYQAYDSQVNTTAACIAACFSKKYRFAGTQYGSQCFCGNAYGGQGPAGACTTPCTGAPTETCGGANQNSVYVAIGAAPQATYVGCYADSPTIRELPDQVFGGQYTTVESCAADCAYHGYLYAGPENGDQCFCGSAYGSQGTAADCTDPCRGNAAEVCGGFNANSIYRTWVPADAGADSGDAGTD